MAARAGTVKKGGSGDAGRLVCRYVPSFGKVLARRPAEKDLGLYAGPVAEADWMAAGGKSGLCIG